MNDYLRRRHSVTKLVAHRVFTTKYRRKLIDGYMIEQLREAFMSAGEKLECDLIEMDGDRGSCSPVDCLPAKALNQPNGEQPQSHIIKATENS